jgi:hypothetical protein
MRMSQAAPDRATRISIPNPTMTGMTFDVLVQR